MVTELTAITFGAWKACRWVGSVTSTYRFRRKDPKLRLLQRTAINSGLPKTYISFQSYQRCHLALHFHSCISAYLSAIGFSSTVTMADLYAIREANTRISDLPKGLVAVFLGATSGIGRSTLIPIPDWTTRVVHIVNKVWWTHFFGWSKMILDHPPTPPGRGLGR